ncbi:MAG: hypothetical protein FIB07_08875 [Candidatus Methanoperedens sp.]|nr:hypothetical protein [Candidatus Methanoperedens sp.]
MISRRKAGLVLGPVLFLFILLSDIEGIPWEAKSIAASTAWIACWWLTEAIPIPATSLLPIILFPLIGALEVGEVTAEYGNKIIFLLIGGFFIAIAMEKWGLHIRIALHIIRTIGTSPRKTIAGFMAATAFISAWISNTATAMMMVPIATAIIYQASKAGEDKNFNTTIILSIAYAASIGGIATLIGTTPNLIFAGIYRTFYSSKITFLQWAYFGFLLAFFILFICWIYLVYIAYPPRIKALGDGITDEIARLGKITIQERRASDMERHDKASMGSGAFAWRRISHSQGFYRNGLRCGDRAAASFSERYAFSCNNTGCCHAHTLHDRNNLKHRYCYNYTASGSFPCCSAGYCASGTNDRRSHILFACFHAAGGYAAQCHSVRYRICDCTTNGKGWILDEYIVHSDHNIICGIGTSMI